MRINIKDDRVQLLIGVVIAFGLIVGIAVALAFAPGLIAKNTADNIGVGFVMEPARQINDYTLTDQDGRPFKLSQLRGKFALIFFGFINCPDVCPLTMVDNKRIKQELGKDAEKIQFVLISLDGERDTPEAMRRYLSSFDSEFIGLTGSPSLMRGIGADFGVQFEKQKLGSPGINVGDDAKGNYTIAHTSFSYLIDPTGRWIRTFPFQTEPQKAATVIKQHIRQQ